MTRSDGVVGDIEDVDAGSAIGSYRGQGASAAWLVDRLVSRLGWGPWLALVGGAMVVVVVLVWWVATCLVSVRWPWQADGPVMADGDA